jgi:putative FmdB family regulatory protein
LPLYEYLCRACGHRFEHIQKFSDPILKKCPNCKKLKLEKLLSAPAVQFKGTGWYVTDYGGKKSESDKSESADKGSSDKGSSDKAGSSEKGGSNNESGKGAKDKESKGKASKD